MTKPPGRSQPTRSSPETVSRADSGQRTAQRALVCANDLRSSGHRSRLVQMGYDEKEWGKTPIVAIRNAWSDINTCHSHFKELVEHAERGALQAGGFPVELPVQSLSESALNPTSMLYRNFLAMDTEELLRAIRSMAPC